jgi:hypothetical protein
MLNDFSIFLWLLKLGAFVNLYFLVNTLGFPATVVDAQVLIPARILFGVSAYRCLFPVQYKDHVVFHDSPFSSIFLTRLLATFSEVAYIYLLSSVIRVLNTESAAWINVLASMMVLQVVISQCFVWGAILSRRLLFFYYEELGWASIFALNTIASAYLYLTVELSTGAGSLLRLNLLFGLVYLPWQVFHLRVLHSDARRNHTTDKQEIEISWSLLKDGLWRSIHERKQASDADAWGRLIGLTWMTGYWATLIPMWVNQIVVVLSR